MTYGCFLILWIPTLQLCTAGWDSVIVRPEDVGGSPTAHRAVMASGAGGIMHLPLPAASPLAAVDLALMGF